MALRAISAIDWGSVSDLPGVLCIHSRHPHTTVIDFVRALWAASPLWNDRIAKIEVYALSNPVALLQGLRTAREYIESRGGEPWLVVLVRGGGSDTDLERFNSALLHADVQAELQALASRLVFAAGHCEDRSRFDWVRSMAFVHAEVPYAAGVALTERLRAAGVFTRVHEDLELEDGIPALEDLSRANSLREHRALQRRLGARLGRTLEHALPLPDLQLIDALARGGVILGAVSSNRGYRLLIVSADYMPFLTDSSYDKDEWLQILESFGIDDWEIEQALQTFEGDREQ